jgi:hypothetical protein
VKVPTEGSTSSPNKDRHNVPATETGNESLNEMWILGWKYGRQASEIISNQWR